MQTQQRFNNRSADILVGSDAFACNKPTRMSALIIGDVFSKMRIAGNSVLPFDF
jgi:hypothetical protein